jgi:catechol 2,3-dioxygenase-like lactoylglutathione lyase family enzyme
MAARLVGTNHVALCVTDVDRSADWYCELLGLTVVSNERNVGPPYFTDVRYRGLFDLTTLTYVIALHEHPQGAQGPFDPRHLGLDHIGFSVPEREDLDDWVSRLDAKGVPHSGIIEAPYATVVPFRDPDDIALELIHPKVDFWAGLVNGVLAEPDERGRG